MPDPRIRRLTGENFIYSEKDLLLNTTNQVYDSSALGRDTDSNLLSITLQEYLTKFKIYLNIESLNFTGDEVYTFYLQFSNDATFTSYTSKTLTVYGDNIALIKTLTESVPVELTFKCDNRVNGIDYKHCKVFIVPTGTDPQIKYKMYATVGEI